MPKFINDLSLYLLAGGGESSEGRLDEELAIEELADAGIVSLNVVEGIPLEMPFCAVVLYAQRFEVVGIESFVAVHSAKSI